MLRVEQHQTAQLINIGIFRRITLREDLNGKIKQVDIPTKVAAFPSGLFRVLYRKINRRLT